MACSALTIRLQSGDGVLFEAQRDIFKYSNTINTIIENLGIEDGTDTYYVVVLHNQSLLAVVARTMGFLASSFFDLFIFRLTLQVIDWCEYHRDDPPPPVFAKHDDMTVEICPWGAQLFNVNQRALFEIILAANSLDIKGLLNVACQTVANMAKGKSPDEIRKLFNINENGTLVL